MNWLFCFRKNRAVELIFVFIGTKVSKKLSLFDLVPMAGDNNMMMNFWCMFSVIEILSHIEDCDSENLFGYNRFG